MNARRFQYFSAIVFAALAIAFASPTFASIILAIDFGGSDLSVLEPGFQSFTADPPDLVTPVSQTYGAYTVSATGTEPGYSPYYRGEIAPTAPYSKLYSDFIFVNGGAFSVEIDGLAANTTYQLQLYSYDADIGAATTFTPTIGTGSPGSVTAPAHTDPTSDDEYSTLVTWTSDASGTLAFDTNVGLPRLDGLVLSIPEPASLGLLAVGGVALLRRRRA